MNTKEQKMGLSKIVADTFLKTAEVRQRFGYDSKVIGFLSNYIASNITIASRQDFENLSISSLNHSSQNDFSIETRDTDIWISLDKDMAYIFRQNKVLEEESALKDVLLGKSADSKVFVEEYVRLGFDENNEPHVLANSTYLEKTKENGIMHLNSVGLTHATISQDGELVDETLIEGPDSNVIEAEYLAENCEDYEIREQLLDDISRHYEPTGKDFEKFLKTADPSAQDSGAPEQN